MDVAKLALWSALVFLVALGVMTVCAVVLTVVLALTERGASWVIGDASVRAKRRWRQSFCSLASFLLGWYAISGLLFYVAGKPMTTTPGLGVLMESLFCLGVSGFVLASAVGD